MNLRYSLLLVSAAALLQSCATGVDVYNVANGHLPSRELIYYALPRNVVRVDVPVTQTVANAPKCSDPDFLTELGLKLAESGSELGDVKLSLLTEADPTAVYAIDLPPGGLHKFTSTFELADIGTLSTASVSDENQTAAFATSVLKTVAGVLVNAGVGQLAAPEKAKEPNPCDDAKLRIATLRAVRQKYIVAPSLPNTRPDGLALKTILDDLDAQIAKALRLFTGTTTATTATIACEVRPGTDRKTTLFYVAKDGQIVNISKSCAVPGSLNSGTTGTGDVVELSIDPDDSSLAAVTKGIIKLGDKTGFVYRIPAPATIVVSKDGGLLTRDHMLLAQLGTLNALPRGADAHAVQAVVNATFHPATGGLKKLDFNTTPPDTTAISNTADAANAILQAREKKKEAEAAAEDELAQLTRQRQILEEKKKIHDLENPPL